MNYQQQLQHVHDFWFGELSMEDWFGGGDELDKRIKKEFSDLHAAAARGECWQARMTPQLRLAEIIVLDQFSRQIYRGSGQAFQYDTQALTLAQEVVLRQMDANLTDDERMFLYMPFMHSESKVVHEAALRLYEALSQEESLKYEQIHKDIIDRFGRYPHRNERLGRESTDEEKEYLENNHENFF
jgi:uncharacterized protein (DUF924 family)